MTRRQALAALAAALMIAALPAAIHATFTALTKADIYIDGHSFDVRMNDAGSFQIQSDLTTTVPTNYQYRLDDGPWQTATGTCVNVPGTTTHISLRHLQSNHVYSLYGFRQRFCSIHSHTVTFYTLPPSIIQPDAPASSWSIVQGDYARLTFLQATTTGRYPITYDILNLDNDSLTLPDGLEQTSPFIIEGTPTETWTRRDYRYLLQDASRQQLEQTWWLEVIAPTPTPEPPPTATPTPTATPLPPPTPTPTPVPAFYEFLGGGKLQTFAPALDDTTGPTSSPLNIGSFWVLTTFDWHGPGLLIERTIDALQTTNIELEDKFILWLFMMIIAFIYWTFMPEAAGPWRLLGWWTILGIIPLWTPMQYDILAVSFMLGASAIFLQGRAVWHPTILGGVRRIGWKDQTGISSSSGSSFTYGAEGELRSTTVSQRTYQRRGDKK